MNFAAVGPTPHGARQLLRRYFAQVRLQCRVAPRVVAPIFTLAWTQLSNEPPGHLFPTSLVVPGALVFDVVCALAMNAHMTVAKIVAAAIAPFMSSPSIAAAFEHSSQL